MCAESNTTRKRSTRAPRSALGLGGTLALLLLGACDSGYYYVERPYDPSVPAGNGRVAVSWSLGGDGVPLTAERCQSERIDYMNVFVVSGRDEANYVEFTNVACALDRYSVAMTPTGNVRLFVDAIRKQADGRECARYSARGSAVATSQFPDKPTPLALTLAGDCK